MKRTNLFFFIWVMIFLPITAQAEDLPTIPESIWEIRSQGIAVAVLLSNHNENGFRRDAIKVYIKNTSARKIELGGGGRDWGIQVFYQNASGQKSILHESDEKKNVLTFRGG